MMKCTFTGHEADPVRNQGLEFGHCRHCRRDLLRTNGRWRRVPRGFRVVWQRGPKSSAAHNAAQLELDLASPGRAIVPWDLRRSLVANARNRAAGLTRLMAGWLSARGNAGYGSIGGRAPAALLRLRARVHVLLRPARPEACIRLPYRPIALRR